MVISSHGSEPGRGEDGRRRHGMTSNVKPPIAASAAMAAMMSERVMASSGSSGQTETSSKLSPLWSRTAKTMLSRSIGLAMIRTRNDGAGAVEMADDDIKELA